MRKNNHKKKTLLKISISIQNIEEKMWNFQGVCQKVLEIPDKIDWKSRESTQKKKKISSTLGYIFFWKSSTRIMIILPLIKAKNPIMIIISDMHKSYYFMHKSDYFMHKLCYFMHELCYFMNKSCYFMYHLLHYPV